MKSLTELEREAYIAGAVFMADVYARQQDALEHQRILQAELEDRILKLDEQIEELHEELDDSYQENFEIRGLLEEAEWRVLQNEE